MNSGGSTLLQHCLGSCKSITQLLRTHPDKASSSEGHKLAASSMPSPWRLEVGGIWTEKSSVFSDDKNYNWQKIKKIWFKSWAKSAGKPLENMVLLEKSPPNVIRANLLQKHFLNSYFIVMVRNPYAISEGLRRRLGYNIKRCAIHWGEATRFQVKNLKTLNNVIWLKYEDLCDNQALAKTKIVSLLPELNDLSFEGNFSGHHSLHGRRVMPVKNLNNDQIKNLSRKDIKIINNVLSKYKKELNYFNYKMI
jgi:hypothetical protein